MSDTERARLVHNLDEPLPKRVYKACLEQCDNLKQLLGADAEHFRDLIFNTEPL